MIYKTFEEWKDGQWLEDGEPRKQAYTKDELLLVEMGWKYGFDAGKLQQALDADKDRAMDELVKWQQEFDKPVAWMIIDVDNGKSLQFKENKFSEINIPLYTAPRELSDDELNKAFDYYCETDEGVLRFNYELRDEWKKEQLIRWKEAFKKASEK